MPPRNITERELRDDDGEILRRVEAGESFTIVRDGRSVADIVPQTVPPRGKTMGEVQEEWRRDLPPMDVEQWYRDRAADDEIFGDDRLEYRGGG